MTNNNDKKVLNVPNLRFPEFSGEWKKCTIGELTIKVGSGVTPRGGEAVYKTDGHPFVRSQNVGLGQLLLDDIAYIDEDTHQRQKNTELQLDDVLLNITGASIGRSAMATKEIVGGNVNQHVCIIRTQDNLISSFLCNFLLSSYGQKQIDSFQAGGNRQGLNFEQIKSIKITIPTVNEQCKIAQLLQLVEDRISTQNKIIEDLKKLKSAIRTHIFKTIQDTWFLLSELAANGTVNLKRGNIIPKHEYTNTYCYPVYSSSVQNDGLMGYHDSYMFDTELVTWSIDGGGNFFYRPKHKYNITNVSGYILLDETLFNYRFVSEALSWQHSFMVFDYQTKAHPSVILSLYKLPNISLMVQERIANVFELLDNKIQNETHIMKNYQSQKQYLLRQMFI